MICLTTRCESVSSIIIVLCILITEIFNYNRFVFFLNIIQILIIHKLASIS